MSSITLEPVDVDRDAAVLHAWVTHPRSAFWQLQDATLEDVAAEYGRIDADPHHHAWLGRVDGEPAFLAETYDPAHAVAEGLTALAELRPGDLGMHVLVAPPETPVHGFTRRVFAAVLDHCFADASVRRVVAEPDARNHAIRALNRDHGFRELRTLTLPTKEAVLSVCTRADHERDHDPVAHLHPDALDRAQRHLVAKAVAELSHERLLAPEPDRGGWRLVTPSGDTTYTFRARRLALEHWIVDPASLECRVKDEPAALDVQAFVTGFAPVLGIPDTLLPTYLEELASTLAGATWKLRHATATSAELAGADYQEVEAGMTEGHPGFLANNGRIGFGLDGHAAYAPEAGQPVRLVWVAARRPLTQLSLGEGLTEQDLYDGELDADVRAGFEDRLRELGLDPDDYLLLPLHPWQWRHKVAVTFAPDLARRDLVHLGEGPDDYRAQQSIRTFFNADRPRRHYVKTALAVQNMGFVRGLSPAYMEATPAINDWVASVVGSDPTLRDCGFTVLRERAAIGYTGDAYHALETPSPYRKMLAALWRESPLPALAEGERLMTMAALLHRDAAGHSLVGELVARSQLDPVEWVRRYLHAYLRPVVHCLLAHDLAFMPHGENLVLVLRDDAVARVLMKDVGEEVCVMSQARPVPPEVERVRQEIDPDVRALALHTDVFDGVLRFLAAILDEDGLVGAATFWAEVAAVVEQHEADHPDLAGAAAAYDLRRAEFRHSCLNRLQLRNTRQMVDISDQAESLIYAGTLANPIAPHRR